jgi:hypothetical protein
MEGFLNYFALLQGKIYPSATYERIKNPSGESYFAWQYDAALDTTSVR